MSRPLLIDAGPGALPAGAVHGFTTRHGGVNEQAGLSLALGAGSSSSELVENWRRAVAALDPSARAEDLVLMRQVHGREVAIADQATGPLGSVGEVDAVVTDVPGLVLAVRVADCVPILLAGDRHVAAVHAGWRGTAVGVVAATLEVLAARGERPDRLRAVIGPHISGAAYQVGDEVVEGVEGSGVPRAAFTARRDGRWYVDLGAAVAWQLRGGGVTGVTHLGRCTTEPDFFSWRAQGPQTGRLAGLIARRA
jgi:YfiH family protein